MDSKFFYTLLINSSKKKRVTQPVDPLNWNYHLYKAKASGLEISSVFLVTTVARHSLYSSLCFMSLWVLPVSFNLFTSSGPIDWTQSYFWNFSFFTLRKNFHFQTSILLKKLKKTRQMLLCSNQVKQFSSLEIISYYQAY